jgi:hypothetical protein
MKFVPHIALLHLFLMASLLPLLPIPGQDLFCLPILWFLKCILGTYSSGRKTV